MQGKKVPKAEDTRVIGQRRRIIVSQNKPEQSDSQKGRKRSAGKKTKKVTVLTLTKGKWVLSDA